MCLALYKSAFNNKPITPLYELIEGYSLRTDPPPKSETKMNDKSKKLVMIIIQIINPRIKKINTRKISEMKHPSVWNPVLK